jgi:transcriptional regulatory protein RtcR
MAPLPDDALDRLLGPREIDLFDRVQLARVIQICREFSTLAEAGQVLFSSSRG